MYIVMVAMVFHAANNALSAYGTFTQNRLILIVSIIIRYESKRINEDDIEKRFEMNYMEKI